jgi:hypothetical protein
MSPHTFSLGLSTFNKNQNDLIKLFILGMVQTVWWGMSSHCVSCAAQVLRNGSYCVMTYCNWYVSPTLNEINHVLTSSSTSDIFVKVSSGRSLKMGTLEHENTHTNQSVTGVTTLWSLRSLSMDQQSSTTVITWVSRFKLLLSYAINYTSSFFSIPGTNPVSNTSLSSSYTRRFLPLLTSS